MLLKSHDLMSLSVVDNQIKSWLFAVRILSPLVVWDKLIFITAAL
jgi:hypothetical protein